MESGWCEHGYCLLDGESNCRECAHAREVAELRAELNRLQQSRDGVGALLAAEMEAHAATKARLAEAEKVVRTLIAHFDSCGECSECAWESGQIDLKSDVVARLRAGGTT